MKTLLFCLGLVFIFSTNAVGLLGFILGHLLQAFGLVVGGYLFLVIMARSP